MRATTWLTLGAAMLAGATATFVPNVARAYCRAVTATPPAGYDPTQQGCFAAQGDVLQLYWSNACVGYSLNGSASAQITLPQATAIAAQAFASWGGAECSGGAASITAVDEGPVACSLVQYDESGPNQHVIVFRDDGWPYDDSSNTLGLTTITYDATTGEILDADIEINSHDFVLVAAGPVPAGGYDLASVLTHEAGHFLGLAHSDQHAAVMYAHYAAGSTTLSSDDVNGICSIDLPGGARSTSHGAVVASACDPTPRNGFTTECAGDADAGAPGSGNAASPTASKHACAFSPGPGSARAGAGSLALGGALVPLLVARRRRRRARRASSWLALALGLSALGCDGDDTNPALPPAVDAGAPASELDATLGALDAEPPPLPVALVRVANWSPDAPGVDFCLAPHGTSAFEAPLLAQQSAALDAGPAALTYPGVSAYFFVAPGHYDARAIVAGATDCAIGVGPDLTTLPTLAIGTFSTLALLGRAHATAGGEPALQLAAFVDDGIGASTAKVALRFINAAGSIGPVAFGSGTAASAFKPLFLDVAFGAAGTAADAGAADAATVIVDSHGYASISALSAATLSAHAMGQTTDAVVAQNVYVAAGAVVTTALLEAPVAAEDGGAAVQLLECIDNAGTVGLAGPCTILSP